MDNRLNAYFCEGTGTVVAVARSPGPHLGRLADSLRCRLL
jgi:hypothetical protein